MTYKEWVETVPCCIREDAVWKLEAYRLALFAGDLAWPDVTKLLTDKRTISMADQLHRAAGAVSGDIAEGYSRRSGKDQTRFYEYALGSARESRDWYYKGRHVLGGSVAEHRMELLTRVIKSLLTIIPNERGFRMQEEPADYTIEPLNRIDAVPMPDGDSKSHAPRTTYHAS